MRSLLICPRLTSPQAVFYSAVVTWLLPSGYLAGYHFRILGRPFDYQVPNMRCKHTLRTHRTHIAHTLHTHAHTHAHALHIYILHVHVHVACACACACAYCMCMCMCMCMSCQVFSSFTLVGGICTVGWRQFARWGAVDNTYLSCLTAGAAAGALNVLRFLQDLPEMRKGSVLQRELSEGQFRTVSILLVHGAKTSGCSMGA